MKKLFFLLMILLPSMVFGQKAKIEFENTSHNFGTIGEANGKASVDFIFKNTGRAPLILTNVRAGCGCTTPEWNRQPVAPGQSGIIKVSYDPRNRPGSFIKSITVNSNAENPVMSLTIRGNVTRKPVNPFGNYKFAVGPIKMMANSLNLGNIKNTQKIEKSIEIANTGEQAATINVSTHRPYITASINTPTLQKGEKGIILIKYDAMKRNDWGFVSDNVQVTVNNNTIENITVTANIDEDFSSYNGDYTNAPAIAFSEMETTLDNLAKNTPQVHIFYIQNTGKSDLIVRKLKPSEKNMSINVAKSTIKPGKKVKATISFKTDSNPGKKIRLVQFTTNDPKNITLTYKITTNVL
ncbi:MAG: DUF1573 domain-containing protein [Odoribacter sp.]